MPSIDEVLKKLSVEEANAIRDWHDTDVSTEKEKGVTEYRKRSSDVNKLLTIKKKYESFLKDKLEYDPDGDLEAQYEEASKAASTTSSKKSSTEMTELETKYKTELDKINKRLEKAEAEKLEANKKVKTTKISNALTEQMKDIPSAKYVIKDFINDGKVDYDEATDSVVFIDGEDRIELPKALEQFRKENPHLVVVNQVSGSGSSRQSTSSKTGTKQMKTETFKTLSPSEKSAFMKDGGTLYE
jgi:hypothetical protein